MQGWHGLHGRHGAFEVVVVLESILVCSKGIAKQNHSYKVISTVVGGSVFGVAETKVQVKYK